MVHPDQVCAGAGLTIAEWGRRLERSFPGRCLASFVNQQGVDRAMVVASQAFTALIPLLILAAALAPVGRKNVVADAVIHKFSLTGNAAAAVDQVFAHSSDGATGVLGVVLLVFSGVSLTRRLQRMYLQAWALEPSGGVRGSLHATLGLAVLLVEVSLLYAVQSLVRGLPLDGVVGVLTSVLAGLVLWTTVPWLLLNRRVAWRRLLPGGLLTTVLTEVYAVATTIYMPRLMNEYSEQYGLFGVTLALVGWLLCIAFIIVFSTIVAAEFDRSEDPWARSLRRRFDLEPPAGERAELPRPG